MSEGVMRRLCAAAVLGGVLLWFLGAWRQSLWMDEFHALDHARQADLGAFFAALRGDNHPPLYFLLLRVFRTLFGEGHLALRLPSLLAGLATLALLWRAGPRGPWAAALFALSSYALVLVVDARMYAVLALAVAGLWRAAETAREEGRGSAAACAWCLVGLHTHYFFSYFAFVTLIILAVDRARRPERRAEIFRLARAMALALLGFAPWFWWGMRAQLAHDLAPGRSHTAWLDYPASLLHFFFIDVGAGGAVARGLFAAGGLALAFLVVVSIRDLLRSGADARRGRLEALALAAGAPLLAFFAARWVERAGYNWKYVAGGAPLAVWLCAAATGSRSSRPQRAALLVLALAMAGVSLASALDPGREDHLGALRSIAARGTAADRIVISPTPFPDGSLRLAAWHHYAPRLGLDPARGVSTAALDVASLRGKTAWFLVRGPFDSRLRETLRQTHHAADSRNFGRDLKLYRFDPLRPR